MSYRVVEAILAQKEPKAASRMVLVVLAECANAKGGCWPSMRTIAARSGLSLRHAKRIIHGLQQAGHIEIQAGTGRTHPNKYRILLKSDTRVTVSLAERVTSEPERVTSEVIKGDTHVTRTVKNRNKPPIVPHGGRVRAGLPERSRGESEHLMGDNGQSPVAVKVAVKPAASKSAMPEVFWLAYPLKVGKRNAERAWASAAKRGMPPLPELLAKLEALTASPQWRKDGGQFIPHPATWLNRDGWKDEVKEAQQPESFL
jgi:Helix-turn-helix domain